MAYDFGASRQKYINEMEQKKVSKANAEEDKGFDLGKALISPFTTIADIKEDILSGAVKSVEGIVDYGLGLVGSAASIFGSDSIENALNEAIKYDFTGNTIGKIDDWAEDSSWLSADNAVTNTIHQVGQGVGGMLPSIVVAYFSGGASLAASTATFGLGAAGQSTEEAINEGANIGQATGYGTLAGITEAGIELLSGKLGGTTRIGKDVAKNIFGKGIGGVVSAFAEEGLEEVASDLITPAWKAITYSGKYETPEINELIQSFTTGGLTALAMGGAGKATNMAMYGKEGEKALSKYNEILELNKEEYDLETKGKLTKELRDKYSQDRTNLVKEFNEQLDKLDAESKKTQRLNEALGDKSARDFSSGKKLANEFTNLVNKKYNSNIKVEYVDTDAFDAKYVPETNTIKISKSSEKPYLHVLNHEFAHALKISPEYNNLVESVISSIPESQLVELQKKAKAENHTNDINLINEEIASEYIANNVFTNLNKLKSIISGNKTFGQKALDFIKEKLNILTPNSNEYKNFKKIESLISEMLNDKEFNIANSSGLVPKYSKKDSLLYNGYYINSHKKIPEKIRNKAINELVADFQKKDLDYTASSKIIDDHLIIYDIQDDVADITDVVDLKKIKKQKSLSQQNYQKLIKILDTEIIKGGNANADIIRLAESINREELLAKQDTNIYSETVRNNAVGRNDTVSKKSSGNERKANSRLDEGTSELSDGGKVLQLDSYKNELTKEQIQYFKDTKVLDKNGNLLVTYHGSKEAPTTFRKDKIATWNAYGRGFYFTDNIEVAERYARKGGGKLITTYLNITNPFKANKKEYMDKLYEYTGNTKQSIKQYAEENGIEGSEYFIMCDFINEKTNKNISDILIELGYDGIEIKQDTNTEFVVFEPNQIKSYNNLYPTKDADIRYSRKSSKPPKGQLQLELSFEDNVIVENYVEQSETLEEKKPKKTVEPSTRKVAKEMKEYNRQQNLTEQDIDKVIADTEKKVEVVIPGDKKSTIQVVKDKFKDAVEAFKSGKLATYLKTQITDASAGVVDKVKAKYKDNKELRNSKVKELRISVNEAQRATARADWYIGTVVDKIWSPIEAKGEAYVRSFETFLLHKLNVRRMKFSATALNNIAKLEKELDAKLVELADKYNKGEYKNKRSYELDVSKAKSKYGAKIKSWQEEYDNAKDAPVFGKEITAKESAEAAKKLLKEHPEFAEYKEQVADVFEYLRKRQLEAGLISETQFELMEKAAGRDYVPTHRANKDGISKAALSGNIGVKNGLHRAKGSSEDIRSIMVQMCEQIIAVEKKTSINKLFNTVKEMIPEEFTDDKIVSREPVGREDADSNIIPEQNQVFFYENGERVVYQVDNEVASLFQSMRNIPSQFELGVFGKASKGLVKLTRNVTTQYNPFFAARNLFRDYFDAVIYTKNKGKFSQNYVEAAKDVFGKGEWYKMYMENGGASASFYNQDQGRDMSKKGILTKISDFNETIELIPRVAEMKASYERLIAEGKTHEQAIQEAMFDAAEVTVNFGKGGTSTKWLSSNLVPYLNGAVQGSVKFYNTFIHPESFEAWKSAMVRAGLMAIPALILNEALFGDDDDYEELADDVKANYYLFKIGDNKFIRIPRGRIESIFGDFAQRTVRYAKGNEDAFDTYGETIKSSVSPVESFTRTVYSPLKDVSTNTAWHGGKIENRSMENKPIKERYDENTSEIAKMLSNVYPKLSPKKWHYLLDQYSGVIGDIVLPLTSKSASIETVLFKSSGYYVNSMNNNKYSNQYYDLGAELTQNSNSDKATGVDKAKLRYYNSMNTKISELKKQKAELSDDEANATQLLIVQLQRQTIDNLKAFETTLNKYEYGLSDSDTYEDFYRESLRECFGAETALINYDTRVYEKATIFNKCGINWDTFYTVYFDAKSIDSDYDADGNVVSGSKKNKVTQYVKSLKLNATQKYMVMGLLGYKNTNGEQQVRSLLRSKGYNGEELNKIMKMCGYN